MAGHVLLGVARRDKSPARTMLALSIRQPYAEEILRGIKKIEYRSRSLPRGGGLAGSGFWAICAG